MKEVYSLWLCPEGNALEQYRLLINTLATDFGLPKFEPHITLVPDVENNLKDIREQSVRSIPDGLNKIEVKVTGPHQKDGNYYQFVFDLAAKPELDPLFGPVRKAFNVPSEYFPHLSLAYCEMDPTERQKVVDRAEELITQLQRPRTFTFSGVTIFSVGAFVENDNRVAGWRFAEFVPFKKYKKPHCLSDFWNIMIRMKTWQKIRQNPALLSQYLIREKVIDAIRGFFKNSGFHEVQTPVLVSVPSVEPNLEVFETQLRTASGLSRRAFLIMSPEYALKKLISTGMGNIFEITRSFRNEEEISSAHNPEFTILEWYRVNADYRAVMCDFENMFLKIIGSDRMTYQGVDYDLSLPWPRISFQEAFQKYAGKDIFNIKDEDFYQIFFNEIEPKLRDSRRPAFVYDYPVSQASLARKKPSDPRFAERFEVFLAGLELGNCFSELTDANEQQSRFKKDLAERKSLEKTDYPMDADLIEALSEGMPPVSGIAVGVDRLVMLAADVPTISDTLFFPGAEIFDLEARNGKI